MKRSTKLFWFGLLTLPITMPAVLIGFLAFVVFFGLTVGYEIGKDILGE